jgi:hypothetical protein
LAFTLLFWFVTNKKEDNMLLIVEIVLTVFAWRKGWKAWALLPLGIVMCIGFFVGIMIGAGSITNDVLLPLSLLFDGTATVVLIILAIHAPASALKKTLAESLSPAEGLQTQDEFCHVKAGV